MSNIGQNGHKAKNQKNRCPIDHILDTWVIVWEFLFILSPWRSFNLINDFTWMHKRELKMPKMKTKLKKVPFHCSVHYEITNCVHLINFCSLSNFFSDIAGKVTLSKVNFKQKNYKKISSCVYKVVIDNSTFLAKFVSLWSFFYPIGPILISWFHMRMIYLYEKFGKSNIIYATSGNTLIIGPMNKACVLSDHFLP